MRRLITLTTALAALAIPMALPATAPAASQKAQIKQLQHDVKTLSRRIKHITGCLQYVDLTVYGSDDGSWGYLFDNDFLNPNSSAFATTGVDVASPGDGYSSFLILDPACISVSRANRTVRSFGPHLQVIPGTLGHARKPS